MKRSHLVIAVLVAIFYALGTQFSLQAATIDMTLVTETQEGTTTYMAPCPVYYTHGTDGKAVYIIGYSDDDQGYTWETPEGNVTLKGVLDPDPIMNFGGAVIDFGAPSNFSFVFTLPLTAQGTLVRDSFSGSVTNAAGAGVTVTALAPPVGIPEDGDGITEVQVYTLSNNNGATWNNVGLDLMPTTVVSPLGVGNTASTGDFDEGPIPVIAGGPWTHMRADVNFRLTGGGDIFTFSGVKALVPEPSALALLAMSLGMYCFNRRRSVR
jgi:hypothetical protein